MKTKRLKSDSGFTIVELMIALSVLSTILIMSTVILIQIGNLYKKGVNAADLQNTTRNAISDLTSSIQYGGSKPYPLAGPCTPLTCYAVKNVKVVAGVPRDIYSYCIDTTRYSYVLNREQGTDSSKAADTDTPHVMWRDTMTTNATCDPLDITVAGIPVDPATSLPSIGSDVVPDNMRLTRFRVEEVPVGSRSYSTDVWLAYGDDDLVVTDGAGHSSCNGKGSQFCGVSELTNSVTRRLEN